MRIAAQNREDKEMVAEIINVIELYVVGDRVETTMEKIQDPEHGGRGTDKENKTKYKGKRGRGNR